MRFGLARVPAGSILEHGGGMPLVDDRETVEEFAADAADETSGDRLTRGALLAST
jgi:hypothetical protein